jgi:hypothetical protein
MEIDKIINKIDLIASKLNIQDTSDNKTYTFDDLLIRLKKLDKLILNNNESLSQIEILTNNLEHELCIKQSIAIDSYINDIIGCLQSETPEIKNKCANQIKIILNENSFKSNTTKKLIALIDLIINSK